MLHYSIYCRCGHHGMTPAPEKFQHRDEVLRLARCSRCGQQGAVDMRILWVAGGMYGKAGRRRGDEDEGKGG